jgi:hypothetical protein
MPVYVFLLGQNYKKDSNMWRKRFTVSQNPSHSPVSPYIFNRLSCLCLHHPGTQVPNDSISIVTSTSVLA